MIKDLSFKDVRGFVANNHKDVIEDVDKIASLILLFSPFYVRLGAATLESVVGFAADALGVKGEVTGIATRVFDRITGHGDDDPTQRLARMEAAFCLICYTAFFEALENHFQEIAEAVGLKQKEKFRLTVEAVKRMRVDEGQSDTETFDSVEQCVQQLALNSGLTLPHPADSFSFQRKQLWPLYQELTERFLRFLQSLAVWETGDEKRHAEFRSMRRQLPKLAWEYFKGQYFQLATEFNEFFIWGNLLEHDETRGQLRDLTQHARQLMALSKSTQRQIDVGFKILRDTVESLPVDTERRQVHRALGNLLQKYQAAIDAPILHEKDEIVEDEPQLIYPKKKDIFVPQSFKVLRYSQQQLELEQTWRDLETEDDLGPFLLRYLSSPYSTDAPLIILGHPGSGKSLLTMMIAAHFNDYIPIRVQLRNVNTDNTIREQIVEQVREDTGSEITWAATLEHLSKPLLVLLDGYDEILQASGKTHANYVSLVKEFQQDELSMGRPIRVLVTSRITLIDQAAIPQGCAVLRLQAFHETRRQKWIGIWNDTNRRYFEMMDVEPFKLPGSYSIGELARQPLLLTMLALFDSEANELRQETSIEQSALYDRLLKRFIRREREKDQRFLQQPRDEQLVEINSELRRLGVAAVGMFNRRKFNIHVDELNSDLAFFDHEKHFAVNTGHQLSQAEILLGSFFFVYESQAVRTDRTELKTFEFLHNTFGEFLTADFLLETVTDVCAQLSSMSDDPLLRRRKDQMLENLNQFESNWFACLMYNPLSSRPVVLEMMREWLRHKIASKQLTLPEFNKQLDAVVVAHIEKLLSGNDIPNLMTVNSTPPFNSLPLLAHYAIYSLNLIILRVVLTPEHYTFDEGHIVAHGDGIPGWDRLIHLWKSWFSLQSLEQLTAILARTERFEGKSRIRARKHFATSIAGDQLGSIYNVSVALGDRRTAVLSGMLKHDAYSESGVNSSLLEQWAESLGLDFRYKFITKRLRSLSTVNDNDAVEETLREANRLLTENRSTVEEIVELSDQLADIQTMLTNRNHIPGYLMRILRQHSAHEQGESIGDLPLPVLRRYIEVLPPRSVIELCEFVTEKHLKRRQVKEWPVGLLIELFRRMDGVGVVKSALSDSRRLLYERLRGISPAMLPNALLVELIDVALDFGDQDRLEYYENYLRSLYGTPRSELDMRGRFGSRHVTYDLFARLIKLALLLRDEDFLETLDADDLEILGHTQPTSELLRLLELAESAGQFSFLKQLYDAYLGRTVRQPRGHIRHKMIVVEGSRATSELAIYLLKLAYRFSDEEVLLDWWQLNIERQRLGIESLPISLLAELRLWARDREDMKTVRRIEELLEAALHD